MSPEARSHSPGNLAHLTHSGSHHSHKRSRSRGVASASPCHLPKGPSPPLTCDLGLVAVTHAGVKARAQVHKARPW